MKNEDVEILITEFSSVLSTFMKRTKYIYKSVLESSTHSVPQIELLKYLQMNGKSRMSEIGKCMLVSKPYITALSDKLIESGLIAREFDEDDRRIILIDLTDKGRNMIKEYKALMGEEVKRRLEKLSPEEINDMKVMLEAMKNFTTSKFFD